MRICVITKCEHWVQVIMELRESGKRVDKVMVIHPFKPGEILFLDKWGKEMGFVYPRDPYKWGREQKDSKGRSKTEFVITRSIKEAIRIRESLKV